MKNLTTQTKIILLVIWTLIVAGFTWYLLDHFSRIEKAKIAKQIEIYVKKIDSLKTIRKQKLDSVSSESISLVEKSAKILKTIRHEKIIVRDTTYDAMCKYIENYRPK